VYKASDESENLISVSIVLIWAGKLMMPSSAIFFPRFVAGDLPTDSAKFSAHAASNQSGQRIVKLADCGLRPVKDDAL
jgi:hypothetical protein